jgi:glutaredoxin
MPISVTIYGRNDCHLCALAKRQVERVSEETEVDVDIEEIDVDDDPALAAEYGDSVPYVFVDGWPAFKYHVEPEELRRHLEGAES